MGTEGRRAALALAVAVFAISWASILARLASVHGVVATWWRLAVGVAVTAAAWAASRPPLGGMAPAVVASGVALSLHFSLWLESLNHTTVAASTAIVSTYPVYTAVVETLAGRRPSTRQLLGVALSVAAVVVLSQPWASGGTVYGALLALGGAVAGSAYFSLGRIVRSSGVNTLSYTLQAYGVALLASTVYAAALGINPVGVPAASVPYLVLLGLVPMIMGHTMLNYALKYYSATTVTALTLLEPFGATVLALLVLGEKPPAPAIPGVVLAVAGSWLVLTGEKGRVEG